MIWEVQAQAADPAYAAAVEARTSGRMTEALAAFERLSTERQTDADVWLNLGLVNLTLRRYAAADRAFEAALRLAPSYRDARIAYARSALFSERPALARDRLAPLSDDEDIRDLRAQIATALRDQPATWRLDLAHARSELSGGLGHWTSTSVGLGHRQGRDTQAAMVERTRRFGRADVFVEALGARDLGGRSDVWIAIGGAPNAHYRPDISLRGGGSLGLKSAGDWTVRLGADAAWARYAIGDVRGLQPNLTLAWKERLSLTGRAFVTLDERDDLRKGYALRGEWRVTPTLRLQAGWADAPESAEGRTVTVRATSIGAAVDLGRRMTLQAGFTHEARDAYDRDEAALALTARF